VQLHKTIFAASAGRRLAAVLLGLGAPLLLASVDIEEPSQPMRIPTYVAWTQNAIATASNGDAVRGLVIARRCERCHGREGFSSDAAVPNLAGLDKLTIWKQLNDFRSGKRESRLMQPIAAVLSPNDYADLAAYFSLLPTYPDSEDPRAFPEPLPAFASIALAERLIVGGDGQRGIPPCQACHGPIGHKVGAPSLKTQNSDYIREELEEFAEGNRTNDINLPMRSIASLLTNDEKHALAAYYGAGLGGLPGAITK